MPSATTLNFYEDLEVSKTATMQEIKDSYRRLALLHHPDKNPEDQEATARFQRIGLAYETLRDESSRAKYDNRSVRPGQQYRTNPYASSSRGPAFFYNSDSDDDHYFDPRDSRSMDPEEILRRRFYEMGLDLDEMMRRMAAACSASMEEGRKRFRQEVQAREKAAEDQRQAKAKAKQAGEEQKQKSREKREMEERTLQEKRWLSLDATTEVDKQLTCLHSEFWPKEPQKKKFKCGSCRQRRGMTGYRCPHCSLLACQLCLNKFNAKRTAK